MTICLKMEASSQSLSETLAPFKAGTMLIIIVNILINVTELGITMETHL